MLEMRLKMLNTKQNKINTVCDLTFIDLFFVFWNVWYGNAKQYRYGTFQRKLSL